MSPDHHKVYEQGILFSCFPSRSSCPMAELAAQAVLVAGLRLVTLLDGSELAAAAGLRKGAKGFESFVKITGGYYIFPPRVHTPYSNAKTGMNLHLSVTTHFRN